GGSETDSGPLLCGERGETWGVGEVSWLDDQIHRRSEMHFAVAAQPQTLLVVDPAQDQLGMFGEDGMVAAWPLSHDLTAGNLGVADMDDDGDEDVAIFADNSDVIAVLRRDDAEFVPDAEWPTPHGTYGASTFAPLVGDDDIPDLVAVIDDGVVAVFPALDFGDYGPSSSTAV